MSISKRFTQQPCSWIFSEMILASLVIGVFDLITGYQVRLLTFYAAPIFVVAWFCNKRLGVLIALIAGVISLAADWVDGDPDLRGWTQTWEIARHLVSCLAVAWVGSALRSKSDIAAARIDLLEHSQRLEREIVNISDAEQRRIGQDLHDGLCQHLAALACSAICLREDLKKLHLEAEAAAAGELADLLEDGVVQTRDLARGLVPAHLARVGLVPALELLAHWVSRMQSVSCTFELQGVQKHYDKHMARDLYRIAQEAISNAIRHGKATNIAVSLSASDDITTLRICDNGVGISPARTNRFGMGLNIMRYRAHQQHGELNVERLNGGGTVIQCTARTDQKSDEIAAA